jgi:hypothetical protein
MPAPNLVYPPSIGTPPEDDPSSADQIGPIVPYHSQDETCILCWSCHGFVIGPPGRRLCACAEPGPASRAEADKLQALAALRDARAVGYQRRWFKLLLPHMEGADEDEALAVFEALWRPACERAARRLAERGLR